jgi:Tol biopolymer transport system component
MAGIPACTPTETGPEIVFQSARDGNFELYTMNADGSSQRRLTNSPANDITPAWSPDGTTIAFASDRDGNWEVYTIHPDGSNLTRLTRGEGANTSPSWMPDGTGILFVSTRDIINGELYLMRPDGGHVRRLTQDSLVKDAPVMSPDGRTILVTVNTREQFSLVAYPSGGGAPTRLTPASYDSRSAKINSRGEVVFLANREGPVDVYSLSLDSPAVIARLTVDEEIESAVAWTGDNNRILVAKNGGITVLTLPAGPAIPLSSRGDGAPDWRSE